jgi:aminoglycoside phosphotransferase family enzyme/predicted kinase
MGCRQRRLAAVDPVMSVVPPALQRLLDGRRFPHPVRECRLIETHISWLLLTGDWVYKFKRPLDLGFLDFTTLEQRRFFCEEELRLNRRFAPALYDSVCALSADGAIDGAGEVVDYAVKMRQFDQEQLFDALLARGEVDASLLRQLARSVAEMHAALPPVDEPGQPASFVAALRQNFSQLRDYPLAPEQREALAAIEQWCEAQLTRLGPLLEQRCADGWVRECHGDLHFGNIARWQGQICLFDCIEFNRDFRVIDTIAEVAFLVMDLQARGYHPLGSRLLSDYLEYRGDYGGMALFDLYRCHYALVRAKVQLMRQPVKDKIDTEAPGYAEFLRYLALAAECATPAPRFLAITYGFSGSGKSTLAMQLVEASGAVRLRSDVERKRLFGLAPEQQSPPALQRELYAAATTVRVFERLCQLAADLLAAGLPCVVDATFLHRRAREPLRQLAERLDIPFVILECHCPEAELRRRLQLRRGDASEADEAVMLRQREFFEAPADMELAHTVRVESGAPLPAELLQRLGCGR